MSTPDEHEVREMAAADDPRAAADDEGLDDGTGRRRSGRGWLAAAFVLLVLAALYAGAALFFGDKVAADTTVAGVRVGGMTQDEARATLEDELADDEAREVSVTGSRESFALQPADAGLRYDYDETLEGLTGFSLNPVDLFGHVSGGTERDLEVAVDDDALARAVDGGVADLERAPVEGSVRLDGSDVQVKESRDGLAVDREALADAIRAGWPATLEYEAPESAVEPTLAQADIERFVEEDLSPLVSGPVTIATTDPAAKGSERDVDFEVPAAALASAVSVSAKDGTLSVDVDEKKLTDGVVAAGRDSGTLRAAQDAGVVREGGRDFSVTPSTQGLGLKSDEIAEPVREAMGEADAERRAEVPSEATEPELTTAEARRTLPEEEISTFSTTLTDNADRTENIQIASRTLDGTYVAPGETFSLNAVLGERTGAKGYNKAPVILNGRLVDDYGGGISQLSTTLFNAVFFSGAKIEEFTPHSFYIPRYPEGREATISWPDLDNSFTNDTGAGILIESRVSGGEVTVTFFGREKYQVEAIKGPRTNVRQPDRIVDDAEGCIAQAPAVGFDVQITRVFNQGGREVDRSTFTTSYQAEDEVVCR